ncbi:PREDICTED: DNA damage-inducible protein 1-like [Branchiostoma belcheri]|uniref:DNA damage-inducible protein 1-like n=1 Tax=Branchiostoma belcheri TaxID=7741 RepID=A0A6P5ABM2_BRABE|nr:PREDICTED: DNA damage-inducible protein 1-like [Branchiostoma belcheri]
MQPKNTLHEKKYCHGDIFKFSTNPFDGHRCSVTPYDGHRFYVLPELAELNSREETSSRGDAKRKSTENDVGGPRPSGAAATSPKSVNGQTPANSAASSSGNAPKAPFPEEDIAKLVQLGFPRRQAIEELGRTNGNVDMASMALLAKSLKFQ